MKKNLTSSRVITSSVLFAATLLVLSTTSSFSDETRTVGGNQYIKVGMDWFTVEHGLPGFKANLRHLTLRLKDRGDVGKHDFSRSGLNPLPIYMGRFVDGFYMVTLPPDSDAFSIAHRLESTGVFEDIYFETLGVTLTEPNDPKWGTTPMPADSYDYHWNLRRIDMQDAWEVSTGSVGILLGVVDDGVDLTHRDLTKNYSSPVGWDFVDNDGSPDAIDSAKHGTNVMGILGASTNNGTDISGVFGGWDTTQGFGAPRLPFAKTSIMNMRAGYWCTTCNPHQDAVGPDWCARAIDTLWRWAHAKVINASWAATSAALKTAIKKAADSGDCVIVAAAGNYARGSSQITYPATDTNTIAVGATDLLDKRWIGALDSSKGSAAGPQLDVMAPGFSIPTTQNYTMWGLHNTWTTGTSEAAATVSGQAALIRTVNPNLKWRQIRDILRNTADKVSYMGGQNRTDDYGWGRVNVYKSLKAAIPYRYVGDTNQATPTSIPGGTVSNTFVIFKNPDSVAYSNFAYGRLAGNLTLTNTPLVIEKRFRFLTGGYRLDTTRTIIEKEGEIWPEAGGTAVLGNSNVIFQGAGSCVGAKGGTIRIADGATFHVNNGGLIASLSAGTIQIGNNSTLVIDSTGVLQWNASSTWVFGTNAKLEIYGTVNVASNVTLSFPSTAYLRVRPSSVFTFGTNSTLQFAGTVEVTDGGNLTFPSGSTVSVSPGTSFLMSYPSSITTSGNLKAVGTSTSRISFSSSSIPPQAGDWLGIACSGSGPDTLTFCNIKYAGPGLTLTNTSGTSYMQNDTISQCSSGGKPLYVSNTGTATTALRMYKCGINNNWTLGMQVNNAKVTITYTRIEKNCTMDIGGTCAGILVGNGALVYMDSCRIDTSGARGIYVSGLNSRVSLSADEVAPGYNTINQHYGTELYVASSATAFSGSNNLGPHGGWNNIFNTYTNTCRLVNNTTTNTVSGAFTYWGSSGNRFCGPIDTINQLGSPVSTPAKIVTSGDRGGMNFASQDATILAWLRQLRTEVEGDSTAALDALHELALYVGPGGAYPEAMGIPWDTLLARTQAGSGSPVLRTNAIALQLQAKLDRSEFRTSRSSSDLVLATSIDDDLWWFCQRSKEIASVGLGDFSGAEATFNSSYVRGMSIDSQAVSAMRDYILMSERWKRGTSSSLAGASFVKIVGGPLSAKPEEYSLDQNYPNPFNPTTSFRYSLPAESHVTLRIYDVLGREVAKLVDAIESPGNKVVAFEASFLPTGVYFYRLQAGRFVDVKKMVLTK